MPRLPAPSASETRQVARALAKLTPKERRQMLVDAQVRARRNRWDDQGRCWKCGRRYDDCNLCRAEPWPWPTWRDLERRYEKRATRPVRKRSGVLDATKMFRAHARSTRDIAE